MVVWSWEKNNMGDMGFACSPCACEGSLPLSNDMRIKLIGYSLSPKNVNVSVNSMQDWKPWLGCNKPPLPGNQHPKYTAVDSDNGYGSIGKFITFI